MYYFSSLYSEIKWPSVSDGKRKDAQIAYNASLDSAVDKLKSEDIGAIRGDIGK